MTYCLDTFHLSRKHIKYIIIKWIDVKICKKLLLNFFLRCLLKQKIDWARLSNKNNSHEIWGSSILFLWQSDIVWLSECKKSLFKIFTLLKWINYFQISINIKKFCQYIFECFPYCCGNELMIFFHPQKKKKVNWRQIVHVHKFIVFWRLTKDIVVVINIKMNLDCFYFYGSCKKSMNLIERNQDCMINSHQVGRFLWMDLMKSMKW